MSVIDKPLHKAKRMEYSAWHLAHEHDKTVQLLWVFPCNGHLGTHASGIVQQQSKHFKQSQPQPKQR